MGRFGAWGTLLLACLLTAGCARVAVNRLDSTPLVYAGQPPSPRALTVIDGRGGSAWPPGPRDRIVNLNQADDDLAEFSSTVLASLRARGLNVSYSTQPRDIVLHVKLLYSRCVSAPAFSLYEYNETSLQADLRSDGKVIPIIGYFPGVELYIRAPRERGCYEFPRLVVASEVAAKINRALFGGQVPTEIVDAYGKQAVDAAAKALANRSSNTVDFLPALELGYSNNPAARKWLHTLVDAGNPVSRSAATFALGLVAGPEDLPVLGRLYDSGGEPVRFLALKSILEMDSLEAREFVLGVRASRRFADGRIRPLVGLYDFPASTAAAGSAK